jgi:hypothetical protein
VCISYFPGKIERRQDKLAFICVEQSKKVDKIANLKEKRGGRAKPNDDGNPQLAQSYK